MMVLVVILGEAGAGTPGFQGGKRIGADDVKTVVSPQGPADSSRMAQGWCCRQANQVWSEACGSKWWICSLGFIFCYIGNSLRPAP